MRHFNQLLLALVLVGASSQSFAQITPNDYWHSHVLNVPTNCVDNYDASDKTISVECFAANMFAKQATPVTLALSSCDANVTDVSYDPSLKQLVCGEHGVNIV